MATNPPLRRRSSRGTLMRLSARLATSVQSIRTRTRQQWDSWQDSIRTRTRQQWNSWKDSKEKPKVAQYRSRKLAMLQTAPHLLPMLACIILIVLNLRTTFIGSVSTVTLTALQFAAKGLEILMQGSITIVVLAVVRSQLLSSTPLPFGGAIAAYRATDVSYLWSRDFWGAITSKWYRGWGGWAVLLVLPMAVILATLVGPSAAVLMIPRSMYGNGGRILVLTEPNATFYPGTIGLVDGRFHLEAEIEPTFDQVFGGLNSISAICSQQEDQRQKCSFTIIDDTGMRILNYFAGGNTQEGTSQNGFDVATTVSSRLANAALRDAEYTNGLSRILQPYFAMSCWQNDSSPTLRDDDHYVYFGPDKDYLNKLISLSRLSPTSKINRTGDSEYVTLPGSDGPHDSDPTFVSFHKLPERISNDTALMVAFSEGGGMDSCTIAAHWIDAATNITAETTNVDEDFRYLDSRSRETQTIKISLKWLAHGVTSGAASLTRLQLTDSNPILSLTMVSALALAALPSGNSSMPYVAFSPGVVETSGDYPGSTTAKQNLAIDAYCKEQGYYQEYEDIRLYVDTKNWSDPASLAQFVIQELRAGYGYSPQTSTVGLSLTVIMFYVCLATAYLLYSVITGRTATSWNSIAELVALSLNSQPPDVLKNTSVGIRTLETFQQPVYVRVSEHGSLELVFGNGKEASSVYREVVPNEKY